MKNFMDPRSLVGRLARGNNVYKGGMLNAQRGAGGRPPLEPTRPDYREAIKRRLLGRRP